jgi:hypothetical protein
MAPHLAIFQDAGLKGVCQTNQAILGGAWYRLSLASDFKRLRDLLITGRGYDGQPLSF